MIRNGTVVFLGWDSNTIRYHQGLYSVPAGGGPVTKIADYNTPDPSGGIFQRLDEGAKPTGSFWTDSGKVVFQGASPADSGGLYSANVDGSGLALVADLNHPYKLTNDQVIYFSNPTLTGNTIVMFGADGFDPVSGYNGIYTTTIGAGGSGYKEIFNSNTQLPGNPDSRFHTRILTPILATDGNLVAFTADDTNLEPRFKGLYTIPIGGGAITKIVDRTTALPGLGQIDILNSATSIAIDKGQILFRAQDVTPGFPGNNGLFLYSNGAFQRILGTNDILDGHKVFGVFDVGANAISNGRFVFAVDFGPGYGMSVYLATPAPTPNTVTAVKNPGSYATDSIAPGEIIYLEGSIIGPPVLTGCNLMRPAVSIHAWEPPGCWSTASKRRLYTCATTLEARSSRLKFRATIQPR